MRDARARIEVTDRAVDEGTAGSLTAGSGKRAKGSGVFRTILDMIHPPGGLHKESKDSRLTGLTRSLERRVLGLRVTDGKRGE